jgi:hypothetical protein
MGVVQMRDVRVTVVRGVEVTVQRSGHLADSTFYPDGGER